MRWFNWVRNNGIKERSGKRRSVPEGAIRAGNSAGRGTMITMIRSEGDGEGRIKEGKMCRKQSWATANFLLVR